MALLLISRWEWNCSFIGRDFVVVNFAHFATESRYKIHVLTSILLPNYLSIDTI